MKTEAKPGQTYWKIGTKMNRDNYITNEDSPEYLDWDKCQFACDNLHGAPRDFVPIRMVKPVPQPIRPGVLSYEYAAQNSEQRVASNPSTVERNTA